MNSYLIVTLLSYLIIVIVTTTIVSTLKEKNNQNINGNLKKENRWIFAGFLTAFFGVLFPILILILIGERLSVDHFKEIGTIGDFFGGTMVGLLSFASMLFVTAAVVMQKEELKLQREEIKKTRSEFEITNETMKKQAFDSTYFNLISLQKEILSAIKIGELSGRYAISEIFKDLQKNIFQSRRVAIERYVNTNGKAILNTILEVPDLADSMPYEVYNRLSASMAYFKNKNNSLKQEESERNLEYIISFLQQNEVLLKVALNANVLENEDQKWRKSVYEKFYKDHENLIGHYYRNLYRIVKYILESNLSFKDKQSYIGILRAQLSADELKMLYYNIYFSKKGEKFYKILTENKIDFFQDHLNELEFEFKDG